MVIKVVVSPRLTRSAILRAFWNLIEQLVEMLNRFHILVVDAENHVPGPDPGAAAIPGAMSSTSRPFSTSSCFFCSAVSSLRAQPDTVGRIRCFAALATARPGLSSGRKLVHCYGNVFGSAITPHLHLNLRARLGGTDDTRQIA